MFTSPTHASERQCPIRAAIVASRPRKNNRADCMFQSEVAMIEWGGVKCDELGPYAPITQLADQHGEDDARMGAANQTTSPGTRRAMLRADSHAPISGRLNQTPRASPPHVAEQVGLAASSMFLACHSLLEASLERVERTGFYVSILHLPMAVRGRYSLDCR